MRCPPRRLFLNSLQLSIHPSLKGRTVFVTGGGSGIGAAIVAAFAEQGARVAFVDIAESASAALARQIEEAGHAAPWWRACDVRDIAALQKAIADAAAELGDFAVLVNNVASDDRHTLESVTPDYYDNRMAINERPALFAIQSVVPGMKRLGFGSVVNLGSTNGLRVNEAPVTRHELINGDRVEVGSTTMVFRRDDED